MADKLLHPRPHGVFHADDAEPYEIVDRRRRRCPRAGGRSRRTRRPVPRTRKPRPAISSFAADIASLSSSVKGSASRRLSCGGCTGASTSGGLPLTATTRSVPLARVVDGHHQVAGFRAMDDLGPGKEPLKAWEVNPGAQRQLERAFSVAEPVTACTPSVS